MDALMVNPRKRKRRKRRRTTRRRRSYRRRNPGTLRVINPRRGGGMGGDMMSMLTDAAQMSIGAFLAKWVPARFFPAMVTTPNAKAFASIATGVLIPMVGGRMIGKKMARNIGLGATMVGVSALIERFLPGVSGLGQELPLTAAEVDAELERVMATEDVSGLGFAEEAEVGTVDPAFA